MSDKYTLAALLGTPPSERDAKALQFIEEMTQNADVLQKDVLAQILSQNAQTEYLRSFNLGGATDRETFKSRIPVVTYEDLSPLIRRIADGDTSSILTALPVDQFIISSGTSAGQPKLLPTVEGDCERCLFGFKLVRPVMNKYVKGQDQGQELRLRFIKPEIKTRAGLVAHPFSAWVHRSMRLKNVTDYDRPYTSPDEAMVCADLFQSMYVQLLCALYSRDRLDRLGAPFGYTVVRAIKFLQQNWEQMARDIRTGSLDPRVADVSVRECMSGVMRPDPELADLIARECVEDNWEGIITRIWPNAKYIDAIVTGAMAQYIPALDYYSGGLPTVCSTYVTSECFMGVNLNPMCDPTEVVYTIMPNMAYFEFLQQGDETDSRGLSSPILVDLVDVKIGQEYEVVVTTYAGLYRYRVGDILRVSGFYNSTPQFQFVGRKNIALSIDTEKTDESDLLVSIRNVSQLIREYNTSVVEYTSYADTTTIPGHYVIYIELLAKDPTNSPSDKLLEQCCLVMEESFNSIYRRCRVMDKSIGALEIRIVKKGTFEELMNHAVAGGATFSQYKVPRSIRSASMLNLIDSRVISKHFSPSLPHWSAEQHINSKHVVIHAE